MAGCVCIDKKGKIQGVQFWREQPEVSIARVRFLLRDTDPITNIEDALLMLTELQRTGQLGNADRAHFAKWFQGHNLIFYRTFRESCWGKHPIPPEHFWWFPHTEQRQMIMQEAA